ncbi:MAG TPA: NfeD family protein [Blastocatellia bacterium]|nr:NfeD family protein [Blastocatellia bacterium]
MYGRSEDNQVEPAFDKRTVTEFNVYMTRTADLDKFWTILSGGSRRQKRRIAELNSLLQKAGTAHTVIADTGSVLIEGEIWRACSDARIEKGQPIVVIGTVGALVKVESAPEKQKKN